MAGHHKKQGGNLLTWHHPVNCHITFKWRRSLSAGSPQATLQTILAGGIVTGDRAQRQEGLCQLCALCGYETDDEKYRYWNCPTIEDMTTKVQAVLLPLSTNSRWTGVILTSTNMSDIQTKFL